MNKASTDSKSLFGIKTETLIIISWPSLSCQWLCLYIIQPENLNINYDNPHFNSCLSFLSETAISCQRPRILVNGVSIRNYDDDDE